jgi:HK97 family phage portal protein
MSIFFRKQSSPSVEESRGLSFQDVWGAGDNVTDGVNGPDILRSGLRLIPVYAATSLIADMVSTAPWRCFRETGNNARTLMPTQPQIVTNPSPYGSKIDWLHQAMASLLLRGNAIGYIVAVDAGGRPAKVIWLHPDDVSIIEEQQDWFHWPTYYWRGHLLDRESVIHIPAYTFPGSVKGLSPLALFKLQIETGLQAQQFGSDWFKNGSIPAGHMKNVARELEEDEAAQAKTAFKAAVAGRDVLVTGSDWDWTTLSVPANESQFLETIKATATQVAAIYRVSPEDVGGEVANSLTYKTLEQDNSKLTSRTVGVWCSRIEAAVSDRLPNPQYIRFDLDRLARGDMTSRMIAHTAALSAGIETLDEARAAEDKPPLTPEQIQQWQEWFRTSGPSLQGTPPATTPAPKMGVSGGANA